MLPFFSCLAIKLSSSISFYEYRTVAGHIERAVCKSRRTKILIQEMFPSVLSNAADRNRLPRRKTVHRSAICPPFPCVAVRRIQRQFQAILVSVTSAIKSPSGTFGRDSNELFLKVIGDSEILYELFQTKCRIRINLDLFTRQNRSLPARNGCPATNSKPDRFGTVFGKVNVPSAELAGGRSETVSGVSAEKIIFFAFGT